MEAIIQGNIPMDLNIARLKKGLSGLSPIEKEAPLPLSGSGADIKSLKSLAVTYSRTGKPRTTIGAKQFHFRVRDGIGL